MTAVARLRAVPTIAFENDEGRLRRTAGEPTLNEAQGADQGRPRRPWDYEIYGVQMMAKVAVTLIEEMHRNLSAMEDLHQVDLKESIGFNEVSFQVYKVAEAAELLQPG